MDGQQFDRITRELAARLTRRRTLVGVLGLAGFSAPDLAQAGHMCHHANRSCTRDGQCCTGYCEQGYWVPRRRRFRCGCPSPLRACDEQCVDVLTDPDHCGACHEPCVNGECVAGECAHRRRYT